MERVSVVGVAGSGKTTLAEALGAVLEVPVIELDALVWAKPDGTPVAADDLRGGFARVAAGATWVVDGYFGRLTEEIVWPRADTVVWLDLPRHVVLRQAGRRSLRRIVRRERLWGGQRESLRDLLSWNPERSVLRWIWVQHGARRRQFLAASSASAWAGKEVVRLRSRADVDAFLVVVEGRS